MKVKVTGTKVTTRTTTVNLADYLTPEVLATVTEASVSPVSYDFLDQPYVTVRLRLTNGTPVPVEVYATEDDQVPYEDEWPDACYPAPFGQDDYADAVMALAEAAF